jgi:hypothetical protein
MHTTKPGQTVGECEMGLQASQFRQHKAAVAAIFWFESVYSPLNYVLILGMIRSPALRTKEDQSNHN